MIARMAVPMNAGRRASSRFVKHFDAGPENPNIVGERGAALALMRRLELPVPSGFTVTTDAWRLWRRCGEQMPLELARELRLALTRLAHEIHSEQSAAPVLLTVRASPPVRAAAAPATTVDLDWPAGAERPRRLARNLGGALETAWRQWDPERAYAQPGVMSAPRERGIAVVVQRVIAGPPSARSGEGELLTRDPHSGLPGATGHFTPAQATAPAGEQPLSGLRLRAGEAYDALCAAGVLVESAYRDMCELRFRVDDGRLWLLDAAPGARSFDAAVRIAVDLVDEGLIELGEAFNRVPLPALDRLQREVVGSGRRASEPQLARLLAWCEEERRFPLRETAPRGWPVVRSQQQARRLAPGAALIEVPCISPDSSRALQGVVRAALAAGASRLGLRLGSGPIERDLRVPRGPWQVLVAPPQHRWAASLLAARTSVGEVPRALEESTIG